MESISQHSFVEPNPRIRLDAKKWLKLSRKQDLVEAIGWFSILWVTFTFLIDGGINQINNLQSGLGAVERLSALIATDLLLIQTLLIARVPWLDKLYGHDRATATHKKLGKPILYLVLLHFIAVVWSFAIADNKNPIAEFFVMLNTIEDLLLATLALVFMIIVVITSLKIARSKLPYEAWYIVHLLGYGAVMAAIPHQINTGTDIAGKPLAEAFWIAAYMFVALNILWFRFLSPIVLSLSKNLRVAEVVKESSDSVSISISGKKMKGFAAQSGQFFIVRVLTSTQWWRAHPFSISAAPTDNRIRFTVGNRGDDTALLQNIKPGTKVILEGPYGVFTEERRTKSDVVLVAAGIGAPPIRALAENIAAKPGEVTLIYRVRDKSDAPLIAELEALAKKRGFYLHTLEGKRRSNTSWLPEGMNENFSDDKVLLSLAPKVASSDVYVCGPVAFTRSVKESLKKAGTPASQIHAEEFAW
ncbi:MAG: hypothetical protein RIQ88_276 [Actinomycetota bacterium]|jgi:predicted ferric reductase